MESTGLQLCAGQKAGCEAATHVKREIFDEEALHFVDISNAFNSPNREMMLLKIQYLYPQMAAYVGNCYRTPSRLFVAGGKKLSTAEGKTQVDRFAMPVYGIYILPLLDLIKGEDDLLKQVAYADDIGGGSKFEI